MLSLPGEFTAQAHPCTDMFAMIGTLNTICNEVNSGLSAKGLNTLTEQTFFVGKPKTEVKKYNKLVTENFITIVQQKLENFPCDSYTYFAALKHVEKEVLPNKLTSSNIVEVTKNIGKILYPESDGKYRTYDIQIYNALIMPKGRTKEDFAALDRHYKKEENKDVFPTWEKSTRAIVWNAEFAKVKKVHAVDDDDINCLKRIADIAPPATEVASRMKKLEKAIDSKDDCYTIAGRVHQIIVEAHPFFDCNGRAARILMNVVLMQAGELPLIIDNDINYTKAIKEDKFVEYIKDLAKRQPKCEKVVTLALRYLFDTTDV